MKKGNKINNALSFDFMSLKKLALCSLFIDFQLVILAPGRPLWSHKLCWLPFIKILSQTFAFICLLSPFSNPDFLWPLFFNLFFAKIFTTFPLSFFWPLIFITLRKASDLSFLFRSVLLLSDCKILPPFEKMELFHLCNFHLGTDKLARLLLDTLSNLLWSLKLWNTLTYL